MVWLLVLAADHHKSGSSLSYLPLAWEYIAGYRYIWSVSAFFLIFHSCNLVEMICAFIALQISLPSHQASIAGPLSTMAPPTSLSRNSPSPRDCSACCKNYAVAHYVCIVSHPLGLPQGYNLDQSCSCTTRLILPFPLSLPCLAVSVGPSVSNREFAFHDALRLLGLQKLCECRTR